MNGDLNQLNAVKVSASTGMCPLILVHALYCWCMPLTIGTYLLLSLFTRGRSLRFMNKFNN